MRGELISRKPVTWNPVAAITDAGGAAQLADLFTADGKQSQSAHWYLSPANLLTGLLLLEHDPGGGRRAVPGAGLGAAVCPRPQGRRAGAPPRWGARATSTPGAGRGRQFRPGTTAGVLRLHRARAGDPVAAVLPRPGSARGRLRAKPGANDLEQLQGSDAPAWAGPLAHADALHSGHWQPDLNLRLSEPRPPGHHQPRVTPGQSAGLSGRAPAHQEPGVALRGQAASAADRAALGPGRCLARRRLPVPRLTSDPGRLIPGLPSAGDRR